MKKILPLMTLLGVFGLVAFVVQASLPPAPPPQSKFVLADGASSIDELVNRLVAGLAAGDRQQVDSCLITRDEYVNFVLPGAGKPGDPPRQYTEQMNDYAWGTLYGKTIYFRSNLLHAFEGGHYKVKAYEFRKGVRDYAWYRAHQRISVLLETEDGGEKALNTGSIVEVDGKYKFISLIND